MNASLREQGRLVIEAPLFCHQIAKMAVFTTKNSL
jgi:hypothetical protein